MCSLLANNWGQRSESDMKCLIHSAASLSNSMPAEIEMKTRINWFRQHLPEAEQVTDVTIKTAECGTSGEIGN